MGNKQEKVVKQISELNQIASSRRFEEISGLKLTFSLEPIIKLNLVDKIIWDPKDYLIQVSTLTSNSSLSSVLGTASLENFSKINNIIRHLISFSISSTLDEEQICGICLENPSDTILECGHQFCSRDLHDWNARSVECPLCRQSINEDKAFFRIEDYSSEIHDEVKICKDLIFSLIEY